MEVLKPCPFCGGIAEARKFAGEVAYVCCKNCGIQTPYLRTDDAIKRWNRRPREENAQDD